MNTEKAGEKRLQRVNQRHFAKKESSFHKVSSIEKQLGSALLCTKSPAFLSYRMDSLLFHERTTFCVSCFAFLES